MAREETPREQPKQPEPLQPAVGYEIIGTIKGKRGDRLWIAARGVTWQLPNPEGCFEAEDVGKLVRITVEEI